MSLSAQKTSTLLPSQEASEVDHGAFAAHYLMMPLVGIARRVSAYLL